MEIVAVVFAVIMTGLLGIILYTLEPKKHYIRDGVNGFAGERLTQKLQKSGLSEKITPPLYRVFQVVLFMLGFAVASWFTDNLILCLISGAASTVIPRFWIKHQVRRENKKMLQDIEHLYHLLHLQQQAGAYVLDSLIDSYRVVKYWRLKRALINLAGAISNKKPVREATEIFAEQFDNPYIATLADIILHSVEDGNTSSMLQDVSEQIAGIQQAQYVLEKGKQSLETILVLTLLFIGIIAALFVIGFGAVASSSVNIFY